MFKLLLLMNLSKQNFLTTYSITYFVTTKDSFYLKTLFQVIC